MEPGNLNSGTLNLVRVRCSWLESGVQVQVRVGGPSLVPGFDSGSRSKATSSVLGRGLGFWSGLGSMVQIYGQGMGPGWVRGSRLGPLCPQKPSLGRIQNFYVRQVLIIPNDPSHHTPPLPTN
ncbi:hypothetical protein G4B88_000230 [Cannabis sativa]|uniref:Uncharacterized protein n=1 Tax=Cannabis sativa TaxID=3483 RepID=A0A7J6GPI6_CANSA|nr:hypothetical protein G4B88_000230 [Cannabis sativa]